ncbi:MAG: thioredoxin domain-containing protein [Salinibacter sp.]
MAWMTVLRDRLRSYRPQLERILFGLSLLGVLDVIHLYIQQSREFEDGCLGFARLDAAGATFNCSAVTSGPGSTLLGMSNLAWGMGFYLVVAAVTVVVFWAGPAVREWIQGARLGLLAGGVGYSGYLTYLQVEVLNALCVLCLGSALLATLLFAAQVILLLPSSASLDTSLSTRLVKRQATLFVYLAATALVIAGADLVYFNVGLGGSPGPSPATARNGSGTAAQCRLAPSTQPVAAKGASLVTSQDITVGRGKAGVTVIEYFDPNCPHCRRFHDTMKKLVEAYRDEVRFVFKPFALGRSSLPEIQALYVAAQSSKFREMLNAQYARQGPGGIGMGDLRAIASEIGMNPDVLVNRIQQNEYRDQALKLRKRAFKIGVDSTPTILVNGHFVRSRSFTCMKTFIEQAKAGTLGGAASK